MNQKLKWLIPYRGQVGKGWKGGKEWEQGSKDEEEGVFEYILYEADF